MMIQFFQELLYIYPSMTSKAHLYIHASILSSCVSLSYNEEDVVIMQQVSSYVHPFVLDCLISILT